MKRGKRGAKQEEDDDNGFAAWGGYMQAKKTKLLEQFNDAASNITNKQSNLFNGISIFVNGYTRPNSEELKDIMALHGGVYHHYHSTSKTTYIIASNLPDTKIKQLGPNQKIIKPEWVTDCVQAGRILDYTKYLLYTNCNRKQPRLNFEKIVKEESDTKSVVTNNDEDDCQLSPDMFESCDDNSIINNNSTDIVKVDLSLQNKTSNNILKPENDFKLPEAKKVGKPSRTLTANDPKFLSEFYNNSRLHHISTLGATFKQHVCNLREESNFKYPARQKLKDYLKNIKRDTYANNFSVSSKHKTIMHIDMDCFFVSVGLRKHPELRGIPVAVTHSKGGQEPSLRSGVDRQAELDCYKKRFQEKLNLKDTELGPGNMLKRMSGIENQSMSEIASCSYEARKSGVKNGMFMGTALKLCPNLQTMPYDFDGYKEVGYTLYNTISEYTLNIEAVSCDEMFVDITELLKETGATVSEWATYIRSLIQTLTGCPCSTGFGQNRLQARVATKTAKPNGQFHLISDVVEEYMIDIKVDDLPGVGRSTSLKLDSFGVTTCGELQSLTFGHLRSEFGNKIGESLYNHCRGIDDRQLVYEHERKSVSAEVNYGIRFKNNAEAETFLKQLVAEVHTRLTEIKMKGKCITLKLMIRSKDAPEESSKFMGHGICDYVTKSSSLSVPTNDLIVIEREILTIAQKLTIPPQDLRGIGIQISKLEKNKNSNIFGGLTKFLNSTKISAENNKDEKKINQNDKFVYNFKNEKDKTDSKEENTRNSTAVVMFKNKENDQNIKLDGDKEPALNTLNTELLQIQKNKSPIKNNQMTISSPVKNNQTAKSSPVKNNQTAKSSPVKNNQTAKSSPVKSNPTAKRGRGRPRGRGGKTIERNNSNNGDLTKFLTLPNTTAITSPVYTAQVQVQLDGIDMEVFAALPEDIQKEILSEYQSNSIQRENNIESPVENNFTSYKTKDGKNSSNKTTKIQNVNLEDETQEKKININTSEKILENKNTSKVQIGPSTSKSDTNKNSSENMFSEINKKEMKHLLENWVSSQKSPEVCDVRMLGEYFKQLALDKKISNLFEMLKFLFSEITFKNTCGWHKAYFEIVNTAQEGMLEKYGSNIWTHKGFKCRKKCHLKYT